ncbi:MAG TPA: hypothetical protein VIG35_04645 [Gaiellaceae bacterium]|jgi:hypothetical protein
MPEQSHRDEMSAAIRAQRERRAAPRSIAPELEEQAPEDQAPEQVPEPPAEAGPERKNLFGRLRGK